MEEEGKTQSAVTDEDIESVAGTVADIVAPGLAETIAEAASEPEPPPPEPPAPPPPIPLSLNERGGIAARAQKAASAVASPVARTASGWGKILKEVASGAHKGLGEPITLLGNAIQEKAEQAWDGVFSRYRNAHAGFKDLTPEQQDSYRMRYWERMAAMNPERYGSIASAMIGQIEARKEGEKNREAQGTLAEKKAAADAEMLKLKSGPASLKGSEKRAFELSQKNQWQDKDKIEAYQLLGGGKSFADSMMLLQRLGTDDASGNLKASYSKAITSNMQKLAAQLKEEANKATDKAKREGFMGAAEGLFNFSAKLPSMSANAIAAALDNAFGSNKEAMKIAQDAVLAGAYEGLDEDSAKQALFDQFPNAHFSEYSANTNANRQANTQEPNADPAKSFPIIKTKEEADSSGSFVVAKGGDILIKIGDKWYYQDNGDLEDWQ
jgi:hypothetical protein